MKRPPGCTCRPDHPDHYPAEDPCGHTPGWAGCIVHDPELVDAAKDER